MKKRRVLRILIADNDKLFLENCIRILSTWRTSIEVRTTRTGSDCLNMLKEYSPNIIFLGYNLEKMNARVTARFIRSQCRSSSMYYLFEDEELNIQSMNDPELVDGHFNKNEFNDIISDEVTFRNLECKRPLAAMV